MTTYDLNVTATLIWYYYICHREVWLMARQITPDQDDSNLEIGRFIQETRYARNKKEIQFGNLKMDILQNDHGKLVVVEVKKSSKFRESARMQLAYYLKELKTVGIDAQGELRFPEEKRKESIQIDEEKEMELERVVKDIWRIAYLDIPPKPEKIQWCKKCAYAELCWA